MTATVSIGPGGWILIILVLLWIAFMVVRRVRASRSGDDE